MGRLTGKTCFVTGAGQGIGRSIAEAFAAEGARVIGADLRFPVETAAGITRLELDVTDRAAVAAAAAEYGETSVLVNCVGYVANGAILDCDEDDFERSLSLNLRSMYLTVRAFLPAMLARGDGSIINIASVVSSVMAAPNRFAYGATKAAVIGLTMSIARDYAGQRIRCNAISPGTVESPSLHERFASTGDLQAARAAFIARQPMGRLGQPEEIAAVAVLLASREGAGITGALINVDGGTAPW